MKIAQRLIAGSATFSVFASASPLCTNCDTDVVDESLPANANAMDFLEEESAPVVSVTVNVSPDNSEDMSFLQRYPRSNPSKSFPSGSFAQMTHRHNKRPSPPVGASWAQVGLHHNRSADTKSKVTSERTAGNSFVQETQNPFADVLKEFEHPAPPVGSSMVQLGHHHNRGAASKPKVTSKRTPANSFVQTEAEFDMAKLLNDVKAPPSGASMLQGESQSYFDEWLKTHPPQKGSTVLKGKGSKGLRGARAETSRKVTKK